VLAAIVAVWLALLGAGWVCLRGVQARGHLQSAGRLIGQLQQDLTHRDVPAALATLVALQRETGAARAATADPGWRLGRRLPRLGGNLAAATAVTAILDDLARQAFPQLVEVAGSLDARALLPKDGRLDLGALQRATPGIGAARVAVSRAVDRVAAIPVDGLLSRLRTTVLKLHDRLGQLLALTTTAARAAALLPPLLGVNGPRTYLVLFQNLAEVRATGGIPGAFAVVRADQGAVRLVSQGTAAADLGSFAEPVLPLDPAMRSLYTDRLGTYPADVNLTPHFPTAAALARQMYRLRSGTTVDGVLATDPVALSYLLRATGPLPMPTGPPLTADTAVRLLLSDVYARTTSTDEAQSTAEQDEYFAVAAKTGFDALSRGVLDPVAALTEVARAAGERRLLLWSAHDDEEKAISGTVLDGVLPTQDGARPTVGVFLNDGSGAKLGYYLVPTARLAIAGCRPDGRRELDLRVTLRSTVPPTGLPSYVLGLGLSGDPYTVRTNVMVFSPAGGSVVDARLDGSPVPLGTGIERRRAVGVLTVDLKPGASRTIGLTLLTEPLPTGRASAVKPDLWVTPGVTPWRKDPSSTDICSTLR
jgi:hypothetical protein